MAVEEGEMKRLLPELETSPSSINRHIESQFSSASLDNLSILFDQLIDFFTPFLADSQQWFQILQDDPSSPDSKLFPIIYFVVKLISSHSFQSELLDQFHIHNIFNRFIPIIDSNSKQFFLNYYLNTISTKLQDQQESLDCKSDSLDKLIELLFPIQLTKSQFHQLILVNSKIATKFASILSADYFDKNENYPESIKLELLARNNPQFNSIILNNSPSIKLLERCLVEGNSKLICPSLFVILDKIYNSVESFEYLNLFLDLFDHFTMELKKFLCESFERAVLLRNDVWRVCVSIFILHSISHKYKVCDEKRTSGEKQQRKGAVSFCQYQLMLRNGGYRSQLHQNGLPDVKGNLYFLLDGFCRFNQLNELALLRATESWSSKLAGKLNELDWLLVYKYKEYAAKRPTKIDRNSAVIQRVKEFLLVSKEEEEEEASTDQSNQLNYCCNLEHFYDENGGAGDSKLLALIQSRIGRSEKFKNEIARLIAL